MKAASPANCAVATIVFFTVVVTANISGVTQTKGFNDWSGLLDDLYAIGQVSSNDKTQLTELKVPAVYKNTSGQLYKITSFDSESFKDCSNLMSVTIPGTEKEIKTFPYFRNRLLFCTV